MLFSKLRNFTIVFEILNFKIQENQSQRTFFALINIKNQNNSFFNLFQNSGLQYFEIRNKKLCEFLKPKICSFGF